MSDGSPSLRWRRLYGLIAAVRAGDKSVYDVVAEARSIACSGDPEDLCDADAIDALDEFFSALGETREGGSLARVYHRNCRDHGLELAEKIGKRNLALLAWLALGLLVALIAKSSGLVVGLWLALLILLVGYVEYLTDTLCKRWSNCVCGILEGYGESGGRMGTDVLRKPTIHLSEAGEG